MLKRLLESAFLVGLLLTGCGRDYQLTPGTTPIPTVQPTISIDPESQTSKKLVTTDSSEIQNSGGPGTLTAGIERSLTVRHEIELGGEVQVSAGGEAKILGTGVNIGALVAAKYGTTYGSEETIKRSLTFEVPKGTRLRYDLNYYEVWRTGTLRIQLGDQRRNFLYRVSNRTG